MIPIFMTRRGSVRSLVSVPRQDQGLHQLGVGIASAMPSLSVRGVSYDYNNCLAIKSVDLDLVRGNLIKKQGKLSAELESISKKLDNKSFIERAPKHIVEQDKNTYNELKKDIDKIILTIKSLK